MVAKLVQNMVKCQINVKILPKNFKQRQSGENFSYLVTPVAANFLACERQKEGKDGERRNTESRV